MRRPKNLRRAASLAAAATLVIAACGGDDDDTGDPFGDVDDGGGDDGGGDDGGGGGDGDDGGGGGDVQDVVDDLDFGAGMARVTIGDETFELSMTGSQSVGSTTYLGVCQIIFGMIQGEGFVTDGRDISVSMLIPPTDWDTYEDERFDPPMIELEIAETNEVWLADLDWSTFNSEFAGMSQVDDYTLEGGYATGDATFIDRRNTEAGPQSGSFEIRCEE